MNVIELLIAKSIATEGSHMHLVLNLGGPDKVSRADMADVVAEVQGYNKEFVKRVSALSVSIRNVIGTTIILFNSRPLSMRAVQNWSQMEMPQLAGIFFPIDEPSCYDVTRFFETGFHLYLWSIMQVNRGVASPSDISMDIRNLVAEVGINLTSFVTGVALTLHSTPSSLE